MRRLLALPITAATIAALTLTAASAANAADTTTYPGSKPTWATPKADLGAPPVDDLLEGELQFRLKDEAGAERLADAVSTPGSPLYHHYVSPQSWIDRFSPSKAEYALGIAYLKAYGLQIIGTPKSRLFIVYRGTPTQMNAAFKAKMRDYRYQGHTLGAPSVAPSLPARLGSLVQAVNLAQIHHVLRPVTEAQASKAQAAATPATFPIPCSTYYGQHQARLPEAYGQSFFPTDICGYDGNQLRSAYGAQGTDGAGQTIGEVVWYPSPTIQQDVNRWSRNHGAPPLTTLTQILPKQYYNVAECGNDPIEESLDIETMHGMAPKAHIVFSGAADCDYTIDTALSVILDGHLSSVVSNSYGDVGEPTIDMVQAELHQQWQAAAEGIGLYYSTGDYGDDTALGVPASANWFATSPWVTAVGGTSTGIGRDGRITAQTGWGDSVDEVVKTGSTFGYAEPLPGTFFAGANGGASGIFAEPSYQYGVVPSSVSHGMRAIPDVAADASPFTGFITGYTQQATDSVTVTGPYTEEAIGGTSLAAPIVATEAVLAQQRTGCGAIGFANPLLYDLARHGSTFNDVLPSNLPIAFQYASDDPDYLITSDTDSSLTTTSGWDDVTGIGSFSVDRLAWALRH